MSDSVKTHILRSELHDRILAKASEMFQREGIKQVRMDDIANSLSISKRTLYETFKDKEELLLECSKRHKAQKEAYMKQIFEGGSNVLEVVLKSYQYDMRDLHTINHHFFDDMNKYPNVINYMKTIREENFHEAVKFFMLGIEQGLFRSDVNIEIFIRLITLQCDMIFENDVMRQYPLDEIYETIMLTCIRGVVTEKGLQILDELIHTKL